MKIAIPNQTDKLENRVAMDPHAAGQLVQMGCQVIAESGLGQKAHHPDQAYLDEKVEVLSSDTFADAWAESDLLICLHLPGNALLEKVKASAVLIGMLSPLAHPEQIKGLAERGVSVFSMEFIPRISRAQAMDVLSSQSNIGGYMAVILAARACPKIFPMMITAAGTIAPSKVFILGAGVAGLQAIATAKRLGAVVEAYDVRPEVEEQVRSLGGRFIKLPTQAQSSDASGYAKQQTDEQRSKQIQLMTRHVVAADVVITTAAIFGKAPPLLIPQEMVDQMQPGSVIVDMAADPQVGRGNCQATEPGQVVTTPNGIIIDGTLNLPSLAPIHSSHMYANNMLAFLKQIIIDNNLTLNLEDEIQRGACLCHGGEIKNDLIQKALTQS